MPGREHERADEPPGSRGRKSRASNSSQVTARHSRLGLSASAAETFLNCPRCGLAIAQTARSRALAHCPRCIARARARVEMFAARLRAERLLHADGAPSVDDGAERAANGATPDAGDRRIGTPAWTGALSGALPKRRPVIDQADRER